MIYIYILISVFSISLISLTGVIALSWHKTFLYKMLFIFVSLAAGALFGDAIIHLIPEAFEEIKNPAVVSILILLGILTFFVFEKFLRWHHAHGIDEKEETSEPIMTNEGKTTNTDKKPLGVLVLASDSIHNFIDGIIIATGFFISIEVGIATTIAVALHEIPQEISDFALLVHSGMSRIKALVWNFAMALFAVLGAGLTIFAGTFLESYIFHIGAFTAGSFLYIAGSDLVPEIQKTHSFKKSSIQFISIVIGIVIMFSLTMFE